MATDVRESGVGTEPSDESITPTTGRQVRVGAFYLAVVATLALAAVMMRAELVMAFTGWTTDLGTHQVHDLTIFSMLWIAFVAPLALLLYRPAGRVNAAIAPVVFLAPIAVFAVLADSPIVMLPVIFGTLALVVLALHPAGRSLARFDRVEHVNRALAALVVVAALPLLVFAGDQLVRQLTLANEHSLFAHYGAMAIGSVYVVLMGSLAVLRQRDWRFAAWSAGLLAVVIGAASVSFAAVSSVGTLWGSLAILWGVVFVVGVEYVRSRVVVGEDSMVESEVARAA